MHPLEIYIRELWDTRASGAAVPETSYYPALKNLLDQIGRGLTPKVRCIIHPKNLGAGIPDGGLYTPEQFHHGNEPAAFVGGLPARGAIEVKPPGVAVGATVMDPQVATYLGLYGQVLVTNLWEFALAILGEDGKAHELESYRLSPNEQAFWDGAAIPRRLAEQHGERFVDYLKRVMLRAAPLTAPKELAWLLAAYAREAKVRIETADLEALNVVRTALEEALGLRFEGERGEHFFRSSLIQTLFYGVFSAWVLWSKARPKASEDRFNWHDATWWLNVPMIRALFEQVATPSKLGPLNLVEVLDWAEMSLNRVDRGAFFDKFEESRAVQYFL